MASWSVLSKDGAGDASVTAADAVVFVREKFSWLAFLLTPIALIFHRLWLVLIAYLAVGAVLEACVEMFDLPAAAASIVMLGFSFLIALELPSLRVRKLIRKGYRDAGSVVADSLEAAEQRFFEGVVLRPAPAPRPVPPTAPTPPGAQLPQHGIIGSFAGGSAS